MKRLLWQVPAVVSGTAVLTFVGVSALQAAMNEPLQEHGAIVRAERAERQAASAQARHSVTVSHPAPALPPTRSGQAAGSAAPTCLGGCGDPVRVVPGPVAAPANSAEGPRATASESRGPQALPTVAALPGPGQGLGIGRTVAPGQNRDAGGRPAKANGSPAAGDRTGPAGRAKGLAKGVANGLTNGSGAGGAKSQAAAPKPAKGNGATNPAAQNKAAKANSAKGKAAKGKAGKGQGAQPGPDRSSLGPVGKPARQATSGVGRVLDVMLQPPGQRAGTGR